MDMFSFLFLFLVCVHDIKGKQLNTSMIQRTMHKNATLNKWFKTFVLIIDQCVVFLLYHVPLF